MTLNPNNQMQIQNAHIRLLPKKIRELQCIRRGQEQSIALLTKELEEMNRRQRETHGMLMEEGAAKLQRGRKRERRQTTSPKVSEDKSKSIAVPTITTDNIESLDKEREESETTRGCEMCEVSDTGNSDVETNNNLTHHITKKYGRPS